MNKRFSTLLATALVAGGLSSTAIAAGDLLVPKSSTAVTKAVLLGSTPYFYLQGPTADNYLVIGQADGRADSLAIAGKAEITSAKLTDLALWKVKVNYDEVSGAVSSYSFVNKATGKTLGLSEGSQALNGSVQNFAWADATGSGDVSAATISTVKGLKAGEKLVLAKVFILDKDVTIVGDAAGKQLADITTGAGNGRSEYQLIKIDASGNSVVDAKSNSDLDYGTTNKAEVASGILTYATSNTVVANNHTLLVKKGVKMILETSANNKVLTAITLLPISVSDEITMDAQTVNDGKFAAVFAGKAMSFKLNFPTATTVGGNVLSESRFTLEKVTVKTKSSVTNTAVAVAAGENTNTAITVLKSDKVDAAGNALYLRMDTATYDPLNPNSRVLALATLSAAGVPAAKTVVYDYAFSMKYSYLTDSVVIAPTYATEYADATNKIYYTGKDTLGIKVKTAGSTTIIGVRTFANVKRLTLITPTAGEALGYRMGTTDALDGVNVADLKDGASYYIKYLNTTDADKSGKFVVNPFNSTSGTYAYADSAYYLPASQWTVKKDAVGVYTVKSREVKDRTFCTSTAFYTKGDSIFAGADTLQFFAVPAAAKAAHTGYLFLKEEDYRNLAYSISFTDYNGTTTYVNTADSVLKASKEGLFVKFVPATTAETAIGADNLKNMAYKVKVGDKFVVATTTPNGYKLSEVGTPAEFLLRNVKANSYSLISGTNELVIDVKTGAIKAMAVGSVTGNAYEIKAEAAPEYVLDAACKHISFTNDRGDKLAMDANGFAAFRKVSDLKAANYTEDDFKIWVDSAKSISREPVAPSYFIVKNAVSKKGEVLLTGNFLRIMADSAATAKIQKPAYYQAANGAARLTFVPAKREANGDSLLVNYTNEKLTEADSVGYKDKNDKIGEFQFKFAYDKDQADMSRIQAGNGKYVAIYNDVMCVTSEPKEALLVKLEAASAPTSNDAIETATITVSAGQGNVTIAGAAGKKVVISNVLGQVVANTAVTSDDAVIAVPAGIVVVAVEGEAAVKAIVK